MKYSMKALVLLTGAAAVLTTGFAGTPKRPGAPVVVTPPAINDGSNFSRAPFPAARPQNDVTPPDGQAFDHDMAPNTPSTTPAPEPPPPAAVAILQPAQPAFATQTPGLMPTGRATAGAAVSLDSARMQPAIQATTFEQRDTLVESVRTRVRNSGTAISDFRRTEAEMSADARTQFRSAHDAVRDAEKALNRSLKNASRASQAEWESARAQLAADYNTYAAAVARLDATIGISAAQ